VEGSVVLEDRESQEARAKAERDQRGKDMVELLAAIVLSVATIVTAWSAFQATKWGGVMSLEFSTANATRTEATQAATAAGQQVLIDVVMFTDWLNATADDDSVLAGFYEERFRSDFTPAFEAWVATDPLNNPDAPQVPFQMDEYVNELGEEAEALEKEATEAAGRAREANQQGDNYVLTTVLFASVLFFGGVSSKFSSMRAKAVTLGFGFFVLVAGTLLILTFPIEI
jgi:hypothetical protein